ncbi:MAG: PadR family transcriptional regulator [Actinomycetota bacterium]
MSEPEVKSFLPLPSAAFHVLLVLSKEELHGYAVMREVDEISEGAVRMGPGTLYGTIKRMLEMGLVEESGERPDPSMDDERRRYYRITGLGERVVTAEVRRLQTMIERSVLRRLAPRLGEA